MVQFHAAFRQAETGGVGHASGGHKDLFGGQRLGATIHINGQRDFTVLLFDPGIAEASANGDAFVGQIAGKRLGYF